MSEQLPEILGVADTIEIDFESAFYSKLSNEERYFAILSKSMDKLFQFLGTDKQTLAPYITDFVSIEPKALARPGYGHTVKDGNLLGFTGFASHEVDLGGASVGGAIAHAYSLVKTNPEAFVLVAGADVPKSAFKQVSDLKRLTEMVCHIDYEIPYGSTLIAFYSMLAKRLMSDSNITQEQLEQITIFFRNLAKTNPRAYQFNKEVTEKQMRKPLAGCYSTPMIAIVTDHGFATIITSQSKKQELVSKGILKPKSKSVYIAGVGQCAHTEFFYLKNDLMSPAGISAERAFSLSGISRTEVEYAWIYDCFPGMIISQASQYFGTKANDVAKALQNGEIPTGKANIPINSGGGILNYQAAMSLSGATGLLDILSQYDLAVNPIPIRKSEPKVSLLSGNGGIDSINTVVIFTTESEARQRTKTLPLKQLSVASPDVQEGETGTILTSTTVYFNPGSEKKPPYVLVLTKTPSGKMKLSNLYSSQGEEIKTDENVQLGITQVVFRIIDQKCQAVLLT